MSLMRVSLSGIQRLEKYRIGGLDFGAKYFLILDGKKMKPVSEPVVRKNRTSELTKKGSMKAEWRTNRATNIKHPKCEYPCGIAEYYDDTYEIFCDTCKKREAIEKEKAVLLFIDTPFNEND